MDKQPIPSTTLLRRAHRACYIAIDNVLEQYRLKAIHYDALSELAAKPRQSAGEIACVLSLSVAEAEELIRRMEAARLIKACGTGSATARVYVLTSNGSETLEICEHQVQMVEARMTAAFVPGERSEFSRSLVNILEAL